MAVDRDGTFRGMITSHSVGQTKSGLPQFIYEMTLDQWYDPRSKEWFDYSANAATMRSYMVLINRDGAVNDINYRQIKDAFPSWDGQSFDALAAKTFVGQDVVVSIAEETYEGNTSLKIKSLRHYDWKPGVAEADPSKISEFNQKYGHLLRAQAPAPAAAPRPIAPPPPPRAMPQTSAPPVTQPSQPAQPTSRTAEEEAKIQTASAELLARFNNDRDQASAEATKRAGLAAKAYDTEGEAFWKEVALHDGLPF